MKPSQAEPSEAKPSREKPSQAKAKRKVERKEARKEGRKEGRREGIEGRKKEATHNTAKSSKPSEARGMRQNHAHSTKLFPSGTPPHPIIMDVTRIAMNTCAVTCTAVVTVTNNIGNICTGAR